MPPPPDRVLISHGRASWLPPGGRADVVLAGAPTRTPTPVCLVRLLVTRGSSILVQPRPDGRGLDIPTLDVVDDAWEEPVERLRRESGVGEHRLRLLGYVRNIVPQAPEHYPWPFPTAHFVVWHCPLPEHREAPGTWLDAAVASSRLGSRHWWPLAAHAGR